MTRPLRLVVPGFPHHIILRGNNRRRLFSHSSDYQRFLYYLERAFLDEGCWLHAATLMTNHVHLVVSPPDPAALSSCVRSFAQRYAQYFNRRKQATGKLVEQRFVAFPILGERQLAVTTVYVDLNPLRAGMVRDPADYRWTTFGLHAGRPEASAIPRRMWVPSPWHRALGSSRAERGAGYLEWVKTCRAHDLTPERVTTIEVIEALSSKPYTQRIERPDRSSAREPVASYGNSPAPPLSLVSFFSRISRVRSPIFSRFRDRPKFRRNSQSL